MKNEVKIFRDFTVKDLKTIRAAIAYSKSKGPDYADTRKDFLMRLIAKLAKEAEME